jgi:hypothetical protein
LLLAGVAVVVLIGYTGYQALQTKTALQRVAADFEALGGQLADGDLTGAQTSLARAQRNARDAADSSDGPGWWLSGKLPTVGPNVRAVQSVARISDDVASDVLPDIISATRTLQPDKLRPVDGRINLEPLQAGAPAVERAAERLSQQADAAERIDVAPLAPQIATPVRTLQARIAEADGLATRASRAVRLLPPMLGADGPRRYLFAFQNNAEIRATGGIPGSFATITANNGKVRLGRQDDAGTIGRFDEPPVPLTSQEKALFGEALGIFPQDVNFTPHFPRSAELLAGMWEARHRGQPPLDGIVSVDPVALSYLLDGTGPVDTARGETLTSDTAVQLLLSRVYADIPVPAEQNVFFNAAARSVFATVTGGEGDPRKVLSSLTAAGSERRLLIWSRHRAEQRILADSAVGGGLPTAATTTPEVGVYFNAALPYKLDYYLDYATTVTATRCTQGMQNLTVRLNVSSRVPKNFRRLSTYVAPRVDLFGRGTIVTTAYFFAPVDGTLRSVKVDGRRLNVERSTLNGRVVAPQSVALKPGESQVVEVTLTSGPGQTGAPNLQVTPGVRDTGVARVSDSAC